MTQLPTFREIVDALQAQPLRVAEHYAPGGYIDKGKYWALCPFRADTGIGSFYINLTGNYAGRFMDHASGDQGDMLDLIQLVENTDRAGALAIARSILGMVDETPAQKAARLRRQADLERQREQAKIDDQRNEEKRRGRAQQIWMRAQPRLEGTPVAGYLAARAIGLSALGRTPGALRYAPSLPYRDIDPETGEVVERNMPALVAAVHGPAVDGQPPEFYATHRIWLEMGRDGRWGKARVRMPKKIYGTMRGGYIRLWSGIGPRGGKGAPLARASEGSAVFITEGIEDGLSAAVLRPDARVLVAISLGNIAEMVLPKAVRQVTIIADNDPHEEAQKLLAKAVARFEREGRAVGQWNNHHGGKDLNDALMAAQRGAKEQEQVG